AQPPDNPTPDQISKTEQIRQKMLRLAREKYLFRFQERRVPLGVVVANGQVVGFKVAETRVSGRSVEVVPGTEQEIRAPMVVSSIGSVPEMLPGISMKGEYYAFADEVTPRHIEYQHV